MGGVLLEKLEEAICDSIETCSGKSEIELFNSTVVCYDSKLGTYSIGILSRPYKGYIIEDSGQIITDIMAVKRYLITTSYSYSKYQSIVKIKF